jgi:hypothetical protein
MRRALEEIIGILRSSNFDPILPYLNYIILCVVLLIILVVVILILDNKRKENEYTNDKYVRIALKKGDLGLFHLTSLYQESFKMFKSREYIVIEFLNGEMYLRVRSEILNKIPDLKKDKEKKSFNKKDLLLNNKFNDYFEFETKLDFAIPYIPREYRSEVITSLDKTDQFILQICLRPISPSWTNALVSLKRGLEKGRDETKRYFGFVGFVAGIFYPLTRSRKEEKKLKEGEFINETFKKKHAAVMEKLKSDMGFEMTLKGASLSNNDKFVEKIISSIKDSLNTSLEENSNTFGITKLKKMGNIEVNDILLSYLSSETTDILNINEVLGLIGRLSK